MVNCDYLYPQPSTVDDQTRIVLRPYSSLISLCYDVMILTRCLCVDTGRPISIFSFVTSFHTITLLLLQSMLLFSLSSLSFYILYQFLFVFFTVNLMLVNDISPVHQNENHRCS